MKKSILYIVLIFSTLSAAQDLQSYKRAVIDASSPTEILTAIDSILVKSFRKDDTTFISYSLQFIALAKDIDSIDQAAKKAMNLQSILTYSKNDPKLAIRIIDGVLAHKYKITDSFLVGGLYLKRGRANEQLNFNDAIEDYNLAIENFSKKDSLYVADAYLFKGRAFSNMGKYIPASENFNKASDYFEKLNDSLYVVIAKQGIVTMFSVNGFYEKAKEERETLVEKIIELDQKSFLVLEYYNQAYDYKRQGNEELQLAFLLKAERFLLYAKDNANYKMMVHSALAQYYSENKKLKEAERHTTIIDNLEKEINGNLLAESNYYTAKASYFLAKGFYRDALLNAQKKLDNAEMLQHDEERMYAYLLLSKIYREKGDFQLSFKNQDSYNAIKDSLYNSNAANSLAYYEALYKTEKKEKELLEKNTNITLLENNSASFKKTAYFLSFASILAFILILLFRSQRNLKTNKMLQEKFSQKLLISQEEERKRISKDLHDGLGQSLLLIKNNVITRGDQTTKDMVDQVIEEVRAISRDLHPFQLQEMGITRAIKHTLTQVDENTPLFISSEIENIDNLFPPEQEVNIYRIVQESLNNIIKHAEAEASRVSVVKLDKTVLISIKDNGKGFEYSDKLQESRSLGLKTLLERTKVLHGQMRVQSKKNIGTSVEFQFPIA